MSDVFFNNLSSELKVVYAIKLIFKLSRWIYVALRENSAKYTVDLQMLQYKNLSKFRRTNTWFVLIDIHVIYYHIIVK